MFTCRFYLICLVAILYICSCVGNSNANKCVETDKQALLKFKAHLIDDENLYLSSWKGEDCCLWDGIECDNSTGHVTRLYLLSDQKDNNGAGVLRGKIDSSLCELQHLTYLSLSDNNLEGKIPECIGSLGQLTELILADNSLSGAIPLALVNLSNLRTLDLGYNGLVSAIPPALGNLSNLQSLYLGNNDLFVANDLEWVTHLSNLTNLDLSNSDLSQAVDWQSSISKLHSLSYLRLDFCGLPQVNLNLIPQMNSSTSLKSIILSGNHLNSSILSWVLNVSKVLTYLDLSNNSLQHSIPEGFANMGSLYFLDLSYNELEGGIPKSFQNLCQLETLILSSNKLYGQLNDCVSRLCSNRIQELDFSHNQLSGSLPYIIRQFSNLFRLSIYSNNLNGVIDEAHLSNMSKLTILEVDHTSLSFNFSSSWVPSFHLVELSASSCNLGPIFPSWLKHLRQLSILQISNCGISGSIPKWFWDLSPSFVYLNVSRNKLSGALPKSMVYGPELDLSFNNFSGPLPQFPPSINLLSISNNMFSGSISSFCARDYPVLQYLDLSNNILEGQLPNCWAQFKILKVLNLATNKFSGRIPKSLGSLQEIETIHLNNNNFSGEIPSLTSCSNLKVIDFGDNNLGGTLPAWVGQSLHHLIVLRLRVNKLQGTIPTSLCNLLHLQVLDLSKNNITGKIPECLDQITALTDMKFPREIISYSINGFVHLEDYEVGGFIDGAIFAWKGANREYHGKNLGLLTSIDLSYNQLIGEISLIVTKLVALASLNLSGNNLTGFIPSSIGHMKMLESLDLSRNYLYGIVPESLSNLTFLGVMNLSFNNLSGMIPISTQLETFDNSTYIGNPGLCGPPLSKGCSEDSNTHRNDVEGDDELISFGFYIAIGLGFIIGFWGVCGTLTLNTSWRYAYFHFFNNMNDWICVKHVVFMARLKRRLQVQD